MLLGLAGLSVPVILHLIARHKFPVMDFPAIRLLRQEVRTNVFAWRLVDPWQLLLRLLLILLLVLAMARLFTPFFFAQPAPRNLIVVLDASASMFMATNSTAQSSATTPLDVAREVARKLLKPIALPSRCALVVAGDDIRILAPLGPDPQPALQALDKVNVSYGTGPGLVRALAKACEMVQGRHEIRSQIVLLTDRRASAFEARNQHDLGQIAAIEKSMKDQLSIIVVDVSTADQENLAIVDASLRGNEARLGDDAHVMTRLRNFGKKAQSTKLILTAAGKQEPTSRELLLDPNDELLVDLTAQVNRSVRSFAEVALRSTDAVPCDNSFSVPFTVTASRRFLIVDGVSAAVREAAAGVQKLASLAVDKKAAEEEEAVSGAKIMQFALNPGRELGLAFGTGMECTRITPDALPAQTLTRYDVIVLYDVGRLSSEAMADLQNFVRDGRSILIVCAGSVNPMDFNASLAMSGKDMPALSPAQIGNDLVLEPAVGVDLSTARDDASTNGISHQLGPWLSPFRDPRLGDLSVIRFHRIRELRDIENGANVIFSTSEGHPLAIEATRGEGRVVLLSYGAELSRGNIAMTKVFPVLTWRLMDYLTDRLRVKPPDTLVAAMPAVLDVSDSAFRFADELSLSPDPEQATSKDSAGRPAPMTNSLTLRMNGQDTAFVDGLPAGRYWLHKKQSMAGMGQGYARPVAANFDARESDVRPAPERDLRQICGAQASLVTANAIPELQPRGSEVWRLILILLIVAYFVEAISGYLTGVLRDRRKEQEQAAETLPEAEAP
jgi:hypothetical protein